MSTDSAMPLGYFMSRSKFVGVDEAQDRLFRDCMAEAGFVIPEFPPDPPPESRYDPFSFGVAEADSSGYGPVVSPTEDTSLAQPEDLQTWVQSLDERQQEAFDLAAFGPQSTSRGQPIDATDPGDDPSVFPDPAGCDGEAQIALSGSLDDARWYTLRAMQLQAAYLVSTDKALADPSVRDTIEGWVECMSAKGYDATDPDSASSIGLDLKDQADSIKMAGVDARCRESSGYNEVGRRVWYDFQQEWLDEHPDVLPDFVRITTEQIKRSQSPATTSSTG